MCFDVDNELLFAEFFLICSMWFELLPAGLFCYLCLISCWQLSLPYLLLPAGLRDDLLKDMLLSGSVVDVQLLVHVKLF